MRDLTITVRELRIRVTIPGLRGLPGTPEDIGADPAGTAAALLQAHTEQTDPHPQYAAQADLDAKAPLSHTHTPQEVGSDPAGTADAAILAHTDAVDPHPQYATQADLDEKAPLGHTQGSETINTTVVTEAGATVSLNDTHHGRVVLFTSGTAVAVTVPNTLRPDFSAVVVQDGDGQLTLTGDSATIRHRQSHTRSAGRFAMLTLVKIGSGEFRLGGDTTT